LHKSLLSDSELVAIKRDSEGFQRFGRRAAKHLAIDRETTTVARALKFSGLFLPGDHAAKVSTDSRKRNKVTWGRFQNNRRFAAVLEKMGFPRNNITARHGDLITTTAGSDRRKEAKNRPGGSSANQSAKPTKHSEEKFPPLWWRDMGCHADSLQKR
jgi:hypothetical protein